MVMKEKMNVVVIGHVDHGKSTLLGRLLYDSGSIGDNRLQEIKRTVEDTFGNFEYAHILDTLQEEREGRMTIDIMHTWFSTNKRDYTFIDCPGHHEFVRNMLTGASKGDVAILVVSASEGVDDQTREHAFLAKFVGINQFLVAINKMDAVGWKEESYESTKEYVLEMFKRIGIDDYSFVPISGINGDNIFKKGGNIDWHQETLVESMDRYFRSLKAKDEFNIGIVQYALPSKIVGRIESGSINKGDGLSFEPSSQNGVVDQIYVYGRPRDTVKVGEVVELKISGIETNKISRGEVFSKGYNFNKMKKFVGEVFVFTELEQDKDYTLHRGTSKVKCKIRDVIEIIDARKLITKPGTNKVGDSMVAKLKIETNEPIVLEDFGQLPSLSRFILTDSNEIICAGKVLGDGD
jgi:elongation factor 1-alpha